MNSSRLRSILMEEQPMSSLLSKKSSHSLDPTQRGCRQQCNFILDGSQRNYKLPQYDPYRDKHLKSFFLNPQITTLLKNNNILSFDGFNISKKIRTVQQLQENFHLQSLIQKVKKQVQQQSLNNSIKLPQIKSQRGNSVFKEKIIRLQKSQQLLKAKVITKTEMEDFLLRQKNKINSVNDSMKNFAIQFK